MKQFVVWIQSRFNKIRHSLDAVQTQSSPILISVDHAITHTQ